MTFKIVGTGNIAWFLGKRLLSGRHQCTGVYARDTDAAKILAGALLSNNSGDIGDVKDSDTDICFLAVSDMAIPKIAAHLSFKQTMLVHTAGAVSIDTLFPAAQERAVLWPVYSIQKSSLPTHRKIPCAWEASSDKAARYIQSIAHAFTDEIFEARYEQRKWLHLAAVMSNNFINHLMAICDQICTENNVPFTALHPIIAQTMEKASHAHPQELQTGPAIRRDINTIQQHIYMLKDHGKWQKVYEALTDSIQGIRMVTEPEASKK